jgi:hypothetical protein
MRSKAQNIYGGNYHHIGTFEPNQQAALAYDRIIREHGGGKEHRQHGVYANKKRWRAQIWYGGKCNHIGTFDTKQEAALAYDKAAREHGRGKKPLNHDSFEAAEEAAAEAEAEHTLVHGMGAKSKKPRPPSGFHGVYANKKRWRAQITYGGKKYCLGSFDTKQEAALAYDTAAREHGGGKKPLNYDSIEAAEEAAAEAEAEHTLVHDMGAEPKKHRQPSVPSGFYGVRASGKRWQAQITYGGKQHHIGSFNTKQEAALAYDRVARTHGEGKKKLNYDSFEAAEEAAAEAEAEHTLVYGMGVDPKLRPPSGFHGVTAAEKRWKAQIQYGGKRHHIGSFGTKQEAALAYDTAAREHGGGKRKLNYESIKAAEEAAAHAQAEIFADALCAGPYQRRPRCSQPS